MAWQQVTAALGHGKFIEWRGPTRSPGGCTSSGYSARQGVGQIVTFFAYSPPSRPLGSLTPTQPGRVTDPTRGCPGPPWEALQAECWLLRREPKPPA
eukprot:scaffold26433_cov26-Phaeocystis_antarctica.AAC.1